MACSIFYVYLLLSYSVFPAEFKNSIRESGTDTLVKNNTQFTPEKTGESKKFSLEYKESKTPGLDIETKSQGDEFSGDFLSPQNVLSTTVSSTIASSSDSNKAAFDEASIENTGVTISRELDNGQETLSGFTRETSIGDATGEPSATTDHVKVRDFITSDSNNGLSLHANYDIHETTTQYPDSTLDPKRYNVNDNKYNVDNVQDINIGVELVTHSPLTISDKQFVTDSTKKQSVDNDSDSRHNASSFSHRDLETSSKLENLRDPAKPIIAKDTNLRLQDPQLGESSRNKTKESPKSTKHANIDSGTHHSSTSIWKSTPFTTEPTTGKPTVTRDHQKTTNINQGLFITENKTERHELTDSSDLPTVDSGLFTQVDTTLFKVGSIDKASVLPPVTEEAVSSAVTSTATAANEAKPVLHPRTNIFNGAEPEKEKKKSLSRRNQGDIVGLGRRSNMAEVEDTSVGFEQPDGGGQDLIKRKVYEGRKINWTLIRDFSHGAWSFHYHVVGIGFIILAVYSIASIIRLYKRRRLLSKGYFIALNSMMAVMGVFRGLLFLVDPYNAHGILPRPLAHIFLSIGFPCITAAFSILFMALLQTTKVQLISPTIQKPKVLAGIIIFHFTFSVVSDVVLGFVPRSVALRLALGIIFVLLMAIFASAYLYIFRKLYVAATRRQKEMMKLLVRKISSQTGQDSSSIKIKRKLTLSVAIKITLAISILAIIAGIIEIYGMAGPFNVFRTDQPNPWAVWSYITLLRFVELALCFTMSYVASQPLRFEKGGKGPCGRCLAAFCSPCRQILDCRKRDYDLTDGNLNWSDLHSITNSSTAGSFRKISAKESAKSPSEQVGLTSVTEKTKDVKSDHKFGGQTHYSTPVFYQYDSKQQKVKPFPYADFNSNNDSGVVSHSPSGDGNTLTSQHSGKGSRPSSLLINDQGYIRARMEDDTDGVPVIYSTDDELDEPTDMDSAFGKAPRGKSTPASPRSYDITSRGSSEFSFSPPSIHLRQSIEGALDHYNMRLQTPDVLSERLDGDRFSFASRGAQSADELSRAVSPDLGQNQGNLAPSDSPKHRHSKRRKTPQPRHHADIANNNVNNNNSNWNSSEHLSNSNISLFHSSTFPDGSPLSVSLEDVEYESDLYRPRKLSSNRYTFLNSVYNNTDDLAYV